MKHTSRLALTSSAFACALAASTAFAQQESGFYRPLTLAPADAAASGGGGVGDGKSKWSFDVSLYALLPDMSGDLAVKGIPAEVEFGMDDVWDNLDFFMMGKVRVGYDRWALNADVIYMNLGGSTKLRRVDLEQWMVEPTLSYRVSKYFEPFAGVRYNNLFAEISGGLLGRNPSGTQDWWDPIVGANLSLPLGKRFNFNVRGDIGGFGVGSDLAWQAYPYFDWRFAKWGSLQAGYRWLAMDYETGSGTSRFKYDIVNQGPQLGFTIHF